MPKPQQSYPQKDGKVDIGFEMAFDKNVCLLSCHNLKEPLMRGIGGSTRFDKTQAGTGIEESLNQSMRTSSSKLSNPPQSGASLFSRVTDHAPRCRSAAANGTGMQGCPIT